VVAAVRNPQAATRELKSLSKGPSSDLIIVKIDSLAPSDASSAAKELQDTYGITHIDLVIANSGIGDVYAPAYQTKIEDVQEHFAVNTLGPLRLFQGMRSLLSKSTRTPKFVILSTAIASLELTTTFPLQTAAYGASKTAVNFICRRIHAEEDWLVTFPVSPGYVVILILSDLEIEACFLTLCLHLDGFKQTWVTPQPPFQVWIKHQ